MPSHLGDRYAYCSGFCPMCWSPGLCDVFVVACCFIFGYFSIDYSELYCFYFSLHWFLSTDCPLAHRVCWFWYQDLKKARRSLILSFDPFYPHLPLTSGFSSFCNDGLWSLLFDSRIISCDSCQFRLSCLFSVSPFVCMKYNESYLRAVLSSQCHVPYWVRWYRELWGVRFSLPTFSYNEAVCSRSLVRSISVRKRCGGPCARM